MAGREGIVPVQAAESSKSREPALCVDLSLSTNKLLQVEDLVREIKLKTEREGELLEQYRKLQHEKVEGERLFLKALEGSEEADEKITMLTKARKEADEKITMLTKAREEAEEETENINRDRGEAEAALNDELTQSRARLAARVEQAVQVELALREEVTNLRSQLAAKEKQAVHAKQTLREELTRLQARLVAKAKQGDYAELAALNAEFSRSRERLAARAKQGEDEAMTDLAKNLRKDALISALRSQVAELEEVMRRALELKADYEMGYENFTNRTKRIVLRIHKKLRYFMGNVLQFQIDLQDAEKKMSAGASSTSSAPANCLHRDVPALESVSSCMKELGKVIECAICSMTRATKTWIDAKDMVQMVRAQTTKCLLYTIVGKEVPEDHAAKLLATPIKFRIPPPPMDRQSRKKQKSSQATENRKD